MDAKRPLREAMWVWPGDLYNELRNAYAQFRRDFRLARVPAKAPFFVSADQAYMLYVNGRYVGRGPARGYQLWWPYDEHDLAPHLARGRNWISIQAYNAGVGNYGYVHAGAAGMICAGRWGGVDLASGTEWLMRVSPAHRRYTDRLSKQINFQEHVDARLDDQSWIRSPRPPAWTPHKSPVFAVWRHFGAMPWNDMEPRGIPNLGSTVRPYRNSCWRAAGRCAGGFQAWENVTDGLYAELPGLKWKPIDMGHAERGGYVLALPASGPGRMAAVSLDMGEPTIGTLVVEATGARGGEIVDFFFCEALKPDGAPYLEPKWNACGASMSARLRLRPGRTQYEFFQMIGHRHVVAIARDTRRPVVLKLALRECVYPHAIRGRFRSSDEVLTDIYRISARTQQVCSLDAYVDTPWREQAQWWGDARVQGQNTFHMSGDTRLFVRGIRSHARQETPNGLTYGHAPTVAHHCVLPDFSIVWALTIWDYYWQTGDLSLFREQRPRIERLMGYFTGEGRGRNGLLKFDRRYWLFLDWTDIHKTGTPTLLNLWYLYMLEKLALLARLAGLKADERRFRGLCREQKRLVEAKLWDARAGLFRDGLTEDGRPVKIHSVQTQTLAILCGLKKEHHAGMLAKRLVPFVRGRKVPGPAPSCYWVTYALGVLREKGYGADVVEYIRRVWGPMIPFGGTFEDANTQIGKATCTHAWSAHPIYHLAGTVGGVVQQSGGWGRIAFAPLVTMKTVSEAECVVPTPRGLVRASWKREGRSVDVRLALPKGVTAEVRLPGMRRTEAKGRNRWQVEL